MFHTTTEALKAELDISSLRLIHSRIAISNDMNELPIWEVSDQTQKHQESRGETGEMILIIIQLCKVTSSTISSQALRQSHLIVVEGCPFLCIDDWHLTIQRCPSLFAYKGMRGCFYRPNPLTSLSFKYIGKKTSLCGFSVLPSSSPSLRVCR